jgi:L-lactate permease
MTATLIVGAATLVVALQMAILVIVSGVQARITDLGDRLAHLEGKMSVAFPKTSAYPTPRKGGV